MEPRIRARDVARLLRTDSSGRVTVILSAPASSLSTHSERRFLKVAASLKVSSDQGLPSGSQKLTSIPVGQTRQSVLEVLHDALSSSITISLAQIICHNFPFKSILDLRGRARGNYYKRGITLQAPVPCNIKSRRRGFFFDSGVDVSA